MGRVTDQGLHDHVERMRDEHPPLSIGQVDRTIINPRAMRGRFAGTLDYLARVEREVERNLMELLVVLPSPSTVDEFFYADVWGPQELAHGAILDQLQDDLGLVGTTPHLEVGLQVKVLGTMAHIPQVQDVSRMIYYLTGASTERQAVLAYSRLLKELEALGERAIAHTVIHPIKQQEPGHYAFYVKSARRMVQDGRMRPWQLHLTRLLRSRSYNLVGTNGMDTYRRQMGEVVTTLGFDEDLERFAREIGRFEAAVLWADQQGMGYPPYVLRALHEVVELYREQAGPTVTVPGRKQS